MSFKPHIYLSVISDLCPCPWHVPEKLINPTMAMTLAVIGTHLFILPCLICLVIWTKSTFDLHWRQPQHMDTGWTRIMDHRQLDAPNLSIDFRRYWLKSIFIYWLSWRVTENSLLVHHWITESPFLCPWRLMLVWLFSVSFNQTMPWCVCEPYLTWIATLVLKCFTLDVGYNSTFNKCHKGSCPLSSPPSWSITDWLGLFLMEKMTQAYFNKTN